MKYYAVKFGKTPGIYTSWPECQTQINGFPGALYKSFPTRQAAEEFLEKLKDVVEATDEMLADRSIPFAFTDGSNNTTTGVYGYGGYLYDGHEYHILQGANNDAMKAMRNVAGEILGAAAAAAKAKELGLKQLRIYFDYTGIAVWAQHAWDYDEKQPWAAQYIACMDSIRAAGLQIQFVHTKGHSGIVGNELVDRLAKQSVGLSNEKLEKEIEKYKAELQ